MTSSLTDAKYIQTISRAREQADLLRDKLYKMVATESKSVNSYNQLCTFVSRIQNAIDSAYKVTPRERIKRNLKTIKLDIIRISE